MLEAAGELGTPARKRLYAYLKKHPEARVELEKARAELGLLASIPQDSLSPDMMRMVPAAVKRSVHRRLDRLQREKRADDRWKLTYYAVTAVSGIAALLVIVAGIYNLNLSVSQKREREKMATLNTAIDRLAIYSDGPTQYDRDIAEVNSSIAQLQSQDSAAMGDGSRDMGPLFEALVSTPPQSDDDAPASESGAI